MQDLKLLRELIITSEYKNDEAVRCICGTASVKRNKALRSYSRLCELLSESGKTLSEYLFGLAADGIRRVPEKGTAAYRNYVHDINTLSFFSKITAEEIVPELREHFGISADIAFPVFENGDTEITPDTVEEYKLRYGFTVYEANKAFIYSGGKIAPVAGFDRIRLSDLKNYESQRSAVIENTLCFIKGQKYSSVLLYGDRGTGKSSTVKAIVNEYPELRVILIPKDGITGLYDIYEKVRDIPLRFILFIDDLTFSGNEPEYTFLKQALEGSVCVMPENCAIYATTNRRHIVKETVSEREDEHNAADAREEKVSLSDRFGLYITFMLPDKKAYLDIVSQIAKDRKLDIPEETLFALAERFALRKSGRSPRTARQAVDRIEARMALGLDNN